MAARKNGTYGQKSSYGANMTAAERRVGSRVKAPKPSPRSRSSAGANLTAAERRRMK